MTPRRKRRILLLQNPSGGMGSFHLNYTASPPQLNCIPTSFCLTRDSHSAKLRSFPHKTPRGQKWWMGWMSPGFIFLWREGALVAAPNFSLSKTFCSSPKPLGDWRHHQSKPDNPTTSQPWSELMEKSSCCRCWCDKCCSGSVQSPSPPRVTALAPEHPFGFGIWAFWNLNNSTFLPEDEVGSTESFHAGSKSGGNKTSSKQRKLC